MRGPDVLHESDKMQSLARTLDLFELYRDEARKCEDAGVPLAGCVLLGSAMEVVRDMRNLLHPSIYMRECQDKAINGQHLRFSFKVLDAACSCLSESLSRAAESITRQEQPTITAPGEIL